MRFKRPLFVLLAILDFDGLLVAVGREAVLEFPWPAPAEGVATWFAGLTLPAQAKHLHLRSPMKAFVTSDRSEAVV